MTIFTPAFQKPNIVALFFLLLQIVHAFTTISQDKSRIKEALISRHGRGYRTLSPQRQVSGVVHSSLFLTLSPDEDDESPAPPPYYSPSRRHFLQAAPLLALFTTNIKAAQGRGLVQFPCDSLLNTYHLMRAGTSLLEEEGIWSTNPLFLTNREDALSPLGQEQVLLASQRLKSMETLPTIIKHSLSAACIDTCNLIGRELRLGRDRLVPEFTFLDPRAVGKWDMLDATATQAAVWAMDVDEAGMMGLAGRPPPNEDGTPHETLSDQAVRLRQLLSILESQYSGDTILLVFPDGTGPALLSAMMAGIPYNRVHEIEFAPGELRLDVTKASTLELWKSKQGDPEYAAVLERGRKRLAELRSTNDIVSLKDEKMEQERIAIDTAYAEKQARRQKLEEQERQSLLLERQRQLLTGGGQEKAPISPNTFAAICGASAVGIGAYVALNTRRQEKTDFVSEPPTPALADRIAAVGSNATLATTTEMAMPLFAEITPSASNFGSNNMPNRSFRVNGESSTKEEVAKQAMEQYLERDDGFSAWLNSIAEIAAEDDEDE